MKSLALALTTLLIGASAFAQSAPAQCTDLELGSKAAKQLVDILQAANNNSYINPDQSIASVQSTIIGNYQGGTPALIIVVPMTSTRGTFNEVARFFR